jgi:dTDP-4-dehydrorhamnose 3,5-epimerase
MAFLETTSPSPDLPTDSAAPGAIEMPDCYRGIGTVILTTDHPGLIRGVGVEAFAVWPDDRGHFLEVLRVGRSLAADFPPATTQVSAAVTFRAW